MTVKSKGYLRHVALSVADPWETAEFYKQTVGLEEVASRFRAAARRLI